MDLVSEQDLELLEAWLDGELAEAEAGALQVRLGAEPALAAALTQLRAERAVRQTFFASLAGNAAEADAVLAAVKRAAGQRRRARFANRALRYIAAAAACVVIGFAAGWLGRGKPAAPLAGSPPPQPNTVTVYQVGLTDASGQVVWQRFDSPEKARAFAEDVARWRQRQEQMHNGQVVLVADRF